MEIVYSSTVIWELKLKHECFDVGWAYIYLHNTFFNIFQIEEEKHLDIYITTASRIVKTL